MQFRPTAIAGVVEVLVDWQRDARGAFGRTFCQDEFGAHGLMTRVAQSSLSSNLRRGTLRGIHLQAKPHAEAKLVQCVAGRIYDVAVDLRPGSPTYGRYHAVELAAGDGRMLYVPEGCGHGFQTLLDESAVFYQISTPYAPDAQAGVRWNDPAIGVPWPLPREAIVSARDDALPMLPDFAATIS
jgi:dTDP-4-dehydrorhamnose 3,5-epimerase